MENAMSNMNVKNLSCRRKYEPDGVARDQASKAVSGDGEACHFLFVILQPLGSGEDL